MKGEEEEEGGEERGAASSEEKFVLTIPPFHPSPPISRSPPPPRVGPPRRGRAGEGGRGARCPPSPPSEGERDDFQKKPLSGVSSTPPLPPRGAMLVRERAGEAAGCPGDGRRARGARRRPPRRAGAAAAAARGRGRGRSCAAAPSPPRLSGACAVNAVTAARAARGSGRH